MSHFGYIKTISTYKDLDKVLEDIQRHLDWLQGDGSWMGVSLIACFSGLLIQLSSRVLCKHEQKQLLDKSRCVLALLAAWMDDHERIQLEQDKIRSRQLTFEAGIVEPELVYRSIGFVSFLSTWLIRQVDPAKKHPNPLVV